MPACPFESIFNHGDLVFWEAWGEEKGEILFLPLVLKRYLFELDNSPVSRQIARLPLAPATFARLPFVSVQKKGASRDREHKKNCLQYIPTAAFQTCCRSQVIRVLPDLKLEGLEQPLDTQEEQHTDVSSSPAALGIPAHNLFTPK